MTIDPREAEELRLLEDAKREKNWKRWGPYLAERQWGTVREDYSEDGDSWRYLTHDQARSRTYRWGEDGLLGMCDRQGRLCFAIALWNGKDPILKERLFGLSGPEGNHGEDVKELYFYLDSTPTHSYARALYKYPQAEFPYERLVQENGRRGKLDREYEILDTGVFDDDRYFDVIVEYAKAGPNDVLIRIEAHNRGPERASLTVLPTLWFRNTWTQGRSGEAYQAKPCLEKSGVSEVTATHDTLGRFVWRVGPGPNGGTPRIEFTENETNRERLYGEPNRTKWVKDAFHEWVVNGRDDAVNPANVGTKASVRYDLDLGPNESTTLGLRLSIDESTGSSRVVGNAHGAEFDLVFELRKAEAKHFYDARLPPAATQDERRVMKQAYAGLLWTKQFYHYSIAEWLEGDPSHPPPPESRGDGRNREWKHLYNRDVISMPDKWEYPWYAAWDLAFHMIPFARVDPHFAKEQLILFLREWYMHPNGQIPAYEWAFSDVNPPVHAWAVWRVYKSTGPQGQRDRLFLARAFHKLLLNFTWWINRKDRDGNHLFTGGFLGLDNIGIFDRSGPSPLGGELDQADATGWMAFNCATMLSIALELAREDPEYEDVASKFFEHFVAIADAMNSFEDTGLWNEDDGFYHDHIRRGDERIPLRIRSLVGLIPLVTVEVLDEEVINRLPGFRKRMEWFLENRKDLSHGISCMTGHGERTKLLLAIPTRDRLVRLLQRMLDEDEFLSPHGIRSLSKAHRNDPFVMSGSGREYRISYVPGESDSYLFGGNSNWRGPVWLPLNFLIVEALERYHYFYGDDLRVECPTGSGRWMNLKEVADEIARRLVRIFLIDESGKRPAHGDDRKYFEDPSWRDLVLFYEYFDGDTGRGLGASHQTGWTALVATCIQKLRRDP